jgi:hypothetical protein
MRWLRLHRIECGLALFLAGCLGKTDLLVLPPPPPASLEFRFLAEDAATAASLGWSQGVPDVEVTLTPADTTLAPLHLRSNPDGTLNAEDIPGGNYGLYAVRWLSEEERGRLAPGDDAVGFLTKTLLATESSSGPIYLTSSRRQGIVISEIKPEPLFLRGIGTYTYSWYLRLYNNGDSTVYLDGLIIAKGLAVNGDYPLFGCADGRPYTEDPVGIWSLLFSQFPGTGSQYPLAPGQTTVVAMDAIDHRPLFPEGLDLREADFEFYGGAGDVDNPSVPNVPDAGDPLPFGHGLTIQGNGIVIVLSLPVNVASLPRADVYNDARQWIRFPRDRIIETATIRSTYKLSYPECQRLVLPGYDREPVRLLGAAQRDDSLAYRRLELPFTIGGQPILQHTRWSALDFVVRQRAPFAVP